MDIMTVHKYEVVYNSATSGGIYELVKSDPHEVEIGVQGKFVTCEMCQATTVRGKPCEYCGKPTQ